MLLVVQRITLCLIVGGSSSLSARHNTFSTLSPHIPQFNVSFLKNEFQTFLYLESPWIIESPSNTVWIFLFIFNADICCWCNLCHPNLQKRFMSVDVCDCKNLHFDSSRSYFGSCFHLIQFFMECSSSVMFSMFQVSAWCSGDGKNFEKSISRESC